MQSVKWAFSWLGKKKPLFWLSLALNILSTACLMVEPFLFKVIIDDVFNGGQTEKLLPYSMAIVLFALGFGVIRYCLSMANDIMGLVISTNMRNGLFHRVMAQSPQFFRNNSAGDLITKCTGDVDIVRHFIAFLVPYSFQNVLFLLSALCVLFYVSPLYAIILFSVTPISAVIAFRMGRKIRPAHGTIREMRSRLSTVVNESIGGNRIVKAFVRESFEMDKFRERNEGFRNAQIEANGIMLRYAPFLEFFAMFLGLVNLTMGAVMVINGNITLGQLNIFLSMSWLLNEPMNSFGNIINEAQRFSASAEKLEALYYEQNDIITPERPFASGTVRGDIEFKDVFLKISGTEILENISFTVKAGQTIGFMGPTGSGKTVLSGLIPRFADVTSGSVLIDGTDVRLYPLEMLRSSIGLAMQDVFLFSDTIENNIAFGDPEATMERVIACAVTADAHGFTSKLAQGYDTVIGERGTGLSGGQKQRISLARALLPETPILILDDTTSAVDMETEKYIQNELKKLPKQATTIIIAQRVSSIMHADCIYIMENGKITERGTHRELMELGGYYYKTCMLQQGMGGDV